MNNIFIDYDKQLARACESQQELIFKLALVSNYSIEELISLFAQGWYLAPPKGYDKDMECVVDRLSKLSEEIEKESKNV